MLYSPYSNLEPSAGSDLAADWCPERSADTMCESPWRHE